MVIYDLVCASGHSFEGWFRNADDLVSQQEKKLLTCPFCGTESITKKLTAAKVTRKSNSSQEPQQGLQQGLQQELQSVATNVGVDTNSSAVSDDFVNSDNMSKESYAELQKMLNKVHDFVDQNFVDVGNSFAEEALSIHKGEKEAVNIRGTASKSELKELADEGVNTLGLPAKPVAKKDLN